MNPFRWLYGKVKDHFAQDIGLAEVGNGFRYPVKAYAERVDAQLIRGSRPDGREAELATQFSLRGMVNLCAEGEDDKPVEGVTRLRLYVFDNTAPLEAQVEQFILFVDQHAPVYVHCEAGQGRTGVFVACYRMRRDGWSLEQALAEAKAKGLQLDCQENFLRQYGE